MHGWAHKTMKIYAKSTLRDAEDTEKWISQKSDFEDLQYRKRFNWTLLVPESSKWGTRMYISPRNLDMCQKIVPAKFRRLSK